jgi:hypothetical protein
LNFGREEWKRLKTRAPAARQDGEKNTSVSGYLHGSTEAHHSCRAALPPVGIKTSWGSLVGEPILLWTRCDWICLGLLAHNHAPSAGGEELTPTSESENAGTGQGWKCASNGNALGWSPKGEPDAYGSNSAGNHSGHTACICRGADLVALRTPTGGRLRCAISRGAHASP